MIDPLTIIRSNIRSLSPYSTARDEYKGKLGTFLDANESPYDNGLNRYPDPRQRQLRVRLAEINGVEPDNVFVGNGSDEAIDLLFRIFCTPSRDNAVSIAPTYGMYRVAADINDVEMREVALGRDFSLDEDQLLTACDANTRLIFICSPNNPTGNAFPSGQIERIVRRAAAVVVVDEAYIDFSGEPSLLPRLSELPNLVILRTLSKARAMAGLRVGLAFASKAVIGYFMRVKYPYNINCEAQRIALDQLQYSVSVEVEEILSQRARCARELADMPEVVRVYPSDANFLLVEVRGAQQLYGRLAEKGVIVRDRSRVTGCEECLRITIGTPEENDRMLNIIKEYRYEQTCDICRP